MNSIYDHLKSALGSWCTWVSTIVVAISVFRFVHKLFQFGLSDVVSDIQRSYATIIHFPFEFTFQLFDWVPPAYIYDILILWLTLSGAVTRTIQQFTEARVARRELNSFKEFVRALREPFKDEETSLFSRTMAAFIAAYVVLAGPEKGFVKALWACSLMLFSLTFLRLFVIYLVGSDLSFQAKAWDGAMFDIYARYILLIQSALLIACVFGISALNSATMLCVSMSLGRKPYRTGNRFGGTTP